MKVKNIIVLWTVASALMYGGSESADAIKTEVLQKAEIKALKKKVRQLESKLENYTRVKPVASLSPLISKTKTLPKKVSKKKKFVLSDIPPKKLSAYFTAAYEDVETLSSKLETHGFTLLAKDEILKDKTVLSVTNEALKATNSFLSVIHIVVSKDQEVRIQNPSYFAAAYLQKEYTFGDFNETMKSLESLFGELYESEEKLVLADLANYNFMLTLPRFEDSILVAEGENIVSKLTKEGSDKYVSYLLTLPNGSVLVGHKLSPNTYDYLNKVDSANNALLFPYEVMISEGKALMLAPKYYLALSLPLLSMTDFMKIASAPDAIVEEIKEAYKERVADKITE